MIFMCVTKMSNRHFWTETMTSDNNRPLNSKSKQIVYSVSSCFLKIKKKPFGLRTWKGQLKPRVLLELPLPSRIRREKSERCRSSPLTGAKREPYNYVESFANAAIRHNTILHCDETLADSKYSKFSLGWGSVITGSVETLRKRFQPGLLVFCWK